MSPPVVALDGLRAASDAEIEARFASAESRKAAWNLLIRGLQVDWTGPSGTVRLVLVLPDREETWTVRFDATGAALAPNADPDAELRVPLVPFVRLVTGQADGALLFLAGVLEVIGDEDLVLALGETLTAADGSVLIDAKALDPVAVSRAISAVRSEHLASVMAGGFRPLVLREVFGRFPEFLIAEKAAGARVTVCFAIGGRQDGGADRYVVRVADGVCTVESEAPEGERVDATLVLEGHEFLRLVLGHLNPVRGVLSGQLRVEGQVIKALGFNSIMRIPGA